MPKKFGTNTKAAEANARKDAVKQANEREKQQKLEDEHWRDDDKLVQKKQQRKDDRDQKDQEKLQRKLEKQTLLEQEEAALSASKSKKNADLAPKKVTQAQIQQRQATAAAAAVSDEPKRNTTDDLPLEENVNRLQIDGHSARNVDDAIHVLKSTQASVDSHPEKRMKAAYETFETENLPRLKQEHPTLRLSQLKQLMKKEWMKSPDNPFNKPTKAYNDMGNFKQNLPEEKDSDDEDN
ncbi:unnamed protein product [Adineta ricciae]|uniref:Coiled-coil domain-containing protein n=1 Tax=Adineta ricciae TaxID=249248 RepID=A0A815GI35_ADIRI|nr:unnamed protein product [Adineta ricciae]CAF1469358.1 unnamed protein product [Adineta ricciae]